MVSYYKLVGVKSFVLEIRSCNDVPVNLHQVNVIVFLFLFFNLIFIYWLHWVLVVACRIFSCMWDLFS